MVTRIERINIDASSASLPQRWDTNFGPSAASIGDLLRGLFQAPEGYFRVIAVVVTSTPFGQADATVTRDEALGWLDTGLNLLPERVAELPVTNRTQCTALVYEFHGRGFGNNVQEDLPGHFGGRMHLERAGIWSELDGVAPR
jgi:hypothetical protein